MFMRKNLYQCILEVELGPVVVKIIIENKEKLEKKLKPKNRLPTI